MVTREKLVQIFSMYNRRRKADNLINEAFDLFDSCNSYISTCGEEWEYIIRDADETIEAETGVVGLLALIMYDWDLGMSRGLSVTLGETKCPLCGPDMIMDFLNHMKKNRKGLNKYIINPIDGKITEEIWEKQ